MATRVLDDEACHVSHRCENPDRAASAIAQRQLGVITTHQLELVGLGERAIARRAARGVITRLWRGVYLWGAHPAPPGAHEFAACLLAGARACVSHWSAAWLWGLAAPATPVVITVVDQHCRCRPGLTVHRVSAPRQVTDVRGIPVTTPAQTLIDLAACSEPDELERMLSDAYARQLVTERELRSLLAQRRGAPNLRRLIDGGPAITQSKGERLLLKIVRDAGLPRPRTNVKVEGKRVDAWWPEHKLVVEIDGYPVHGHRRAFESDRATDQRLVAAGYRVVRITWRQLVERPLLVAASLAAALARAP